MSINLEKPESDRYSNPNIDNDVAETYKYALECKKKGMADYQVEQSLMNRGLSHEDATTVINNVTRVLEQNRATAANAADQTTGGSGVPGWLLWILALVVFNILSFAFDWGWILY